MTFPLALAQFVLDLSCWFSGDVHSCVFAPWTAGLTEGGLAMFVVGIVYLPLFAKTRDPYLPTVVLVLMSGTAMTVLPGTLASIAWTVIFFSLVLGVFMTFYRAVIQ